jgi:methylated-DNA-protein-cysteine methyltransferase-like protein
MSPANQPTSSSHTLILTTVKRVPRGRVATYGLIARAAGLEGQPRLVGYALRHATDDVPWHRVVNAQGQISPRADPGSIPLQRTLLESEGVEFGLGGRIDLRRYLWKPKLQLPDDD